MVYEEVLTDDYLTYLFPLPGVDTCLNGCAPCRRPAEKYFSSTSFSFPTILNPRFNDRTSSGPEDREPHVLPGTTRLNNTLILLLKYFSVRGSPED